MTVSSISRQRVGDRIHTCLTPFLTSIKSESFPSWEILHLKPTYNILIMWVGDDYTYVHLAYVRSHLNRSNKAVTRHVLTAIYITFLFLFNSLYVSNGGYYLHIFRFLCLKPHFETDRLQRQSDPPNQ
jgi:hypothetical protein